MIFILTSCITYIICNMVEYGLHLLSHNRNIKYLYKSHHYHHTVQFPPHNLVNNDIRYNSIIYNEYLHISCIIWIISYIILPLYIYSIFFIESCVYLYFANLLHECYHMSNSYFEKYKWFQRKKQLHLQHHIKTVHNFNLFDNSSDKVFKTFHTKLQR